MDSCKFKNKLHTFLFQKPLLSDQSKIIIQQSMSGLHNDLLNSKQSIWITPPSTSSLSWRLRLVPLHTCPCPCLMALASLIFWGLQYNWGYTFTNGLFGPLTVLSASLHGIFYPGVSTVTEAVPIMACLGLSQNQPSAGPLQFCNFHAAQNSTT